MIHETRKRSLVKATSFRIVAILLNVGILVVFLDLILHIPNLKVDRAFYLSFTLEGVCFVSYYIFERLFDRIQWGRYYTDE